MVHAHGEFRPALGDPLTRRAYDVFFEVLRVLLAGGATVVAEAAFQDRLWRAGLEPLADLAELRVVDCTTDVAVARARIEARRADAEPGRAAHAEILDLDALENAFASFERLSLAVPTIRVDTTDAYVPELAEVVRFVSA